MMDLEVSKVEAQIEKIVNPNKEPIAGSTEYTKETEDSFKTFIPPFIKATIGINEAGEACK